MPLELSPLDTTVQISDDESMPLWKLELQDLARAFCGGLVVALPLLYTFEMWQRARMIPEWELILVIVGAYFVNVTANYFCGFKTQQRRVHPWLDSITALGVGGFAAAVTLLLIGRIGFSTPPGVVANMIGLELIPVSLGASLAMNQLGASSACDDETPPTIEGADMRKFMATLVGAILFAFNVAPTTEPKIIMTTVTWVHISGIVVFSLFVSALMVGFANFGGGGTKCENGRVFHSLWVETALSYLVSLIVGAALLWMFGYIGPATPLMTMIPWVVVLGYATTLGGSAGRLIL